MITTIFFDGDDTLWDNELYFRQSEEAFCSLMSDWGDASIVTDTLYKREIENIPFSGYGIKNMVISMIETINQLTSGTAALDLVMKAIQIGRDQWLKPPTLRPCADSILQQLKKDGKYRLVLTTKGDANEQIRKARRCELHDYFDYIEVMIDKNIDDYAGVMRRVNCSPEEVVCIGNSLKSDILPLLELGSQAIYLPSEVVWKYEKVDSFNYDNSNLHLAIDLDDALRIMKQDLQMDVPYTPKRKPATVNDIRIDEYNYPLSDEKIAKYPLEQRDHSKLLCWNAGVIEEHHFYDLPDLISPDSLLVYNNTKVIHARFKFFKESGAQIEIFCLEPCDPADYNIVFQTNQRCTWHCLIGNMKRWKEGDLSQRLSVNGHSLTLSARRVDTDNNAPSHIVEFEWNNDNVVFADILAQFGELPIPPYLNRPTEEADNETYQTVYSHINGSVAAPTAGLHFTVEVLRRLALHFVAQEEITLHVGAGTFKPVKSETIGEHPMHREIISVRLSTLKNIIKYAGNITAVGTTSVRTLESLYYLGVHVIKNPDSPCMVVEQWEPYAENDIDTLVALEALENYMVEHNIFTLTAHTRILIAPSFKFRIVDRMITNFHQPKSTLLLLIAAFVGENNWRNIYNYALTHNFRFLSYGDSSLLNRAKE